MEDCEKTKRDFKKEFGFNPAKNDRKRTIMEQQIVSDKLLDELQKAQNYEKEISNLVGKDGANLERLAQYDRLKKNLDDVLSTIKRLVIIARKKGYSIPVDLKDFVNN